MNWTKIRHLVLITLGLLAAFAGVVYQGSLADTQVGPGMTFGLLAGLVLAMWSRWRAVIGQPVGDDYTTIERVFHGAATAAGLLVPIVVLVSSRFAAGSKAFIVGGYVSTVLGDLAKTGGVVPAVLDQGKKIGQLLFLAGLSAGLLLMHPRALAAEPIPSDAAPPISFCLGQTFHCVVPDFNLNTVSYDLGSKKWKAGVTQVGVGYALLFYSDQPWSSGVALHAAGQWSQGQPSYFAVTPTLVFAKFFEVGATFVFLDGAIEKDLTLGLSANFEVLTALATGKSIPQRLQALKLAYREAEERRMAAADEDAREARRIREAARAR